uniref:NAAA-beta domain-containing protein n=1 Tax=Angiostrongylus cantonensis TaxID=6313 RepID=A0A0K0DLS0_ANGCA
MRLAVPLFLVFFVCFCFARYPRRYVVDLDLPASERWNDVVHDHLDAIPGFMKAAVYVPKHLLPIAFFVAQQLNRFFPDEYAEEIRGIARASGLPLGFIVSMNILYDIVAFDRKHIFQMGCTSIVAENEESIILHGRNLDYGIGDLLKNVTILVDFVRWHDQEKKIVYSGVTFALSTTLITGQNSAFTVSLNARCEFFFAELVSDSEFSLITLLLLYKRYYATLLCNNF